ncbi:MAG TPA: hypothetical protein VF692_06835, partial [Pyrinomonadaceae bacterium]
MRKHPTSIDSLFFLFILGLFLTISAPAQDTKTTVSTAPTRADARNVISKNAETQVNSVILVI